MLPQVLHTCTLSIATCNADDSGVISASRFLIRCNAARRAERGPSPGRRANSWIRRSISGPATAGISYEPSPPSIPGGRPSPPASDCIFSCIAASALRRASLHAVTTRSSTISHSSGFNREGSIFTAFTSILAVMRTETNPPPASPSTSTWPSSSCIACIFDCSCAACFIMPRKSGILWSSDLEIIVGIVRRFLAGHAVFARLRHAGIGFRRLGGKPSHFHELGAGEARQHLPDPRIGFGRALALVLGQQILFTQGRLTGRVGNDHGPAAIGPLLELAREIVDQGTLGVALQCDFQPSILKTHQADIGF